jgi:ABC-2 type transport system permease protein
VTAALAARQTAALAVRAVNGMFRLPQAWAPALVFPLMLMAIFTASFDRGIGRIPGFPEVEGFLDFALAGAVLQGVLIGGVSAGAFFASDMEGGFFDRLVASPASRVALLTGRLLAGFVLATLQATLFVAIALAFGARFQGGVAGALVFLALAGLLAVPVGGLGVYLALRTGSAEAVQGMFPLFFALMFFSSAFFPRETMGGWFRTFADANPISWLVEGMRAQVIEGLDWGSAGASLLVIVAFAALTVGGSALALRRRLGGGV